MIKFGPNLAESEWRRPKQIPAPKIRNMDIAMVDFTVNGSK
jgi:hypothetical protein